jgi:hypothetical protein
MRNLVLACMAVAFIAAPVFAALPATYGNVGQPDPSDWIIMPVPGVSETPLYSPYSIEIDQNQPSGPVYMAAFSQTCLAQSFQQTHANIAGAGILLQPSVGSSDLVTIQLWTGLPNAGGTMITSASATGTAGSWVDVYWSPVAITPATTYFLVFTGNSTLGISGSTSNPYPGGCVYANPGYGQFSTFDYAFRTYYETTYALDRSTWAGVKALFN